MRSLLMRLVLIGLVPGLVGVCVLMYGMYENGREQIEKNTVQTARTMVQLVDGHFNEARLIAMALSASSFIAASDWAGFHRSARQLLQREGVGINVVLSDTRGQQIVNTLRPFGEALPRGANGAQFSSVFMTGKPLVTDLFVGAASGKYRVSVAVPVYSGSQVVYLLTVSIGTEALERILREQRLPAAWVSSISDRAGVIAARSKLTGQFTGKLVNPEISKHLLAAPEAAFESVTKEGVPSLLVFSRSPASRWTVAIAIPLADLQADLKRNFLLLGAGALLLFATSAWFARRLGRRIAGSVQALAESAGALASGDEVRAAQAGFREADEVGEAMIRTSQLLNQRGQALAASHATLLEREAVLAQAQRIAHIGSWYWDARTDTTICSDEVCRIFGREAIPPLAEQGGALYPVEAWRRLDSVTREAARTGVGYELELPALFADGGQIWVSVRAEAVRSASGELLGMRGTVQDISERKRAEAQARRVSLVETENRQVQEANRLKSQFLANMSHELRTPLGAIIGFADLIHAGAVAEDTVKRTQFMEHIRSSARHLLRLINDVLDLSKFDSGQFAFNPEPVDLHALIAEVRDVLYPSALARHIDLSVTVDPTLVGLELDPARLRQVLYNYLSNAIKFSAHGGRIELRAMPDGAAHFRIEVEDAGIGISDADLPRLFVDFQQLDASHAKRHQGTGLGLSLVRRIVQAQGGRFGARSTPGVGSVFFVVLKRLTQGRSNAPGDGRPLQGGGLAGRL